MGYFSLLLLLLGGVITTYNGYTDPFVEGIYYTLIGGVIGWLIPIRYNIVHQYLKRKKLDINAVKTIKFDTSNIVGVNYNNFGNTKLCLGNRGSPHLVYYVNLNSWQRFWLRFMGFKVEKVK